jgi:hypothetical protein
MRGDAENVHPARCDMHDEQHVQPAKGHGVDVEAVCREQPACLSA